MAIRVRDCSQITGSDKWRCMRVVVGETRTLEFEVTAPHDGSLAGDGPDAVVPKTIIEVRDAQGVVVAGSQRRVISSVKSFTLDFQAEQAGECSFRLHLTCTDDGDDAAKVDSIQIVFLATAKETDTDKAVVAEELPSDDEVYDDGSDDDDEEEPEKPDAGSADEPSIGGLIWSRLVVPAWRKIRRTVLALLVLILVAAVTWAVAYWRISGGGNDQLTPDEAGWRADEGRQLPQVGPSSGAPDPNAGSEQMFQGEMIGPYACFDAVNAQQLTDLLGEGLSFDMRDGMLCLNAAKSAEMKLMLGI